MRQGMYDDDPTGAGDDPMLDDEDLANPYKDLIGTPIHSEYVKALKARGMAHLEEVGYFDAIDADAPRYEDMTDEVAEAIVDITGKIEAQTTQLHAIPQKVFVYGTLKKGFPRHEALHGCKCLAEDAELAAYAMRSEGGFYPAIFRAWNFFVRGEVYEVTRSTLDTLDRIESVKEGLFRRIREWITVGAARHECWVYIQDYPQAGFERIMHGKWLGKDTQTVKVPAFADNHSGRALLPDPAPNPRPAYIAPPPDPYYLMREKARKRQVHVHSVISWPISQEDDAPLRKGNG